MPAQLEIPDVCIAFIESLHGLEIGIPPPFAVTGVTVAARESRGERIANPPPCRPEGKRGRRQAVRAAFQTGFHTTPDRFPRNDVDGPKQRRGTVSTGGGTLENLNPFDLGDRDREIGRVVPGLRIRDIHSIQQDGDLLACAAAQADIRLDSFRTSLADVNTHGRLQQVIDVRGRYRRYRETVQHRDHAGALPQENRQATGGNYHSFKLFINFLRNTGDSGRKREEYGNNQG